MKEFQQKEQTKSKLYSRYTLLTLFVLIILTGKGLINIYQKNISSEEEKRLVEKKKDELQNRYDSLSNRVEELKTPQGMEKEIRSKFDVVKPGENVIVVVDKEVPAPVKEETNVIKRLWNGVTGVFKKKTE